MEPGVYIVMGLLFLDLAQSTVPGVYIEDLDGYPEQGYAVSIALGTPGQAIRAIVDTGSSNFAVAAVNNINISHYFDKSRSSTAKCGKRSVKALYQFGSWHGSVCQDVIKFKDGPMEFTYLALIEHSQHFFIRGAIWQGILGLAYASLARPDSSVTPVLDSLVASGHIADTFSMSLCGRVRASQGFSYNGTLVLGDSRNLAFRSSLVFTDLVEENFYSIVLSDVQIDGTSLGMDCQSYNKPRTFVDSGTTFLALPPKVFLLLVSRMRQHMNNTGLTPACARKESFWTGTIRCPAEEGEGFLAPFPTITLSIPVSGNKSFAFSLSIPSHLYLQGVPCQEAISGMCYLFSIQESSGGTILGTVLMEGYHVVFDRRNKRIGFADSPCTVEAPYLAKPRVTPPFLRQNFQDKSSCRYPLTPPNTKLSNVHSNVLFVAVVALIMLFVLCSWDSCFGGGRWCCLSSSTTVSSAAGEPESADHLGVLMSDLESRDPLGDSQPLLDVGDDGLMTRISLTSIKQESISKGVTDLPV